MSFKLNKLGYGVKSWPAFSRENRLKGFFIHPSLNPSQHVSHASLNPSPHTTTVDRLLMKQSLGAVGPSQNLVKNPNALTFFMSACLSLC